MISLKYSFPLLICGSLCLAEVQQPASLPILNPLYQQQHKKVTTTSNPLFGPNQQLIQAASEGDWKDVKKALQDGADIKTYGKKAIEAALQLALTMNSSDFYDRNQQRINKDKIPVQRPGEKYTQYVMRIHDGEFVILYLLSHGLEDQMTYVLQNASKGVLKDLEFQAESTPWLNKYVAPIHAARIQREFIKK